MHTALTELKKEFTGARWFVEGDIKGCFDNINHTVLAGLVNSKIKDARLIKLIHKFMKAGYVEDWRYYGTYSGTPQGGIISPILANIYLHELDKFVMKLKADFDVYEEKNYTPEYRALLSKQTVARRHINESSGEERQKWINEYKRIHKLVLKTPAKSQTDKKIKYIRYAARRLTPLECERLQGFPDGWTRYRHGGKEIGDTRRYEMLGNSIAVPCAAYIMQGMCQALAGDDRQGVPG